MSSRSDRFECRWQASRRLLTAYLGAQLLAVISLCVVDLPLWARTVGVLMCLLHGIRHGRAAVLLKGAQAYTGLRREASGWQLWNEASGWQPVQLRPDSLALPLLVVLRFRQGTGHWLNRLWVRSVCIPADAMMPDQHRRLRLRLKFSRRRWAAPE